MPPCLILFCLVAHLFTSPAHADAGWILTTADFQQFPASFDAIDKSAIKVTIVGKQQPESIPFDRFLQIDRASPGKPTPPPFMLLLLSGDRVMGEPVGFKDEQIIWTNPVLGEQNVSLKQARALIRDTRVPDAVATPRTDDLVVLRNGDNAKGLITNLTPTDLVVNSGGADIELKLDTVEWIHFAAADRPKAASAAAFRVRLADGSLLTATAIESDGANLTLTLSPQEKKQIPLSAVAGIEQLNGPVSWLSSRPPEQVIQTPYISSFTWPTRMDQTVGGRPIQFAGRTYSRGIGVHSYSRLDFALDGQWEAFRTQYAMATEEKTDLADVTIRIKLDGQTVHEKGGFKGGVLSPTVIIDIPRSAKMLTLEVDYGKVNDTQDRLNWIEPALLRKRPAPPPPPPATAPATKPATAPTTQP